MPSPFPGVDPYLEGSGDLWQEFHNSVLVYARDALRPRLPAGYLVRAELRVYVDHEAAGEAATYRVPDLEVLRTPPPVPAGSAPARREPAPGAYWIEAPRVVRRELFLTVRSLPGRDW